MQIPNEYLIPYIKEEHLDHGRTVRLPLRGYSMRPYLEDGRDQALLVSPDLDALKRGDVILAQIAQKRYALHRIVSIEGDKIVMYGDGNFSPEYIEKKDVVALAKGFYRKGSEKFDSVDTLSYRLYWRMWVALRPIRRYLLLLWRLYHYPRQTIRRIIGKRP